MPALAALLIGAGLTFAALGWILRGRDRLADLAAALDLPSSGEAGAGPRMPDGHKIKAVLLEPGVRALEAALRAFNLSARITEMLERARVPLRAGEFVFTTAGVAVIVALFVTVATRNPVLAGMTVPAVAWLAWRLLKHKVHARRKAFEAQLPDALMLVASSLEAGHTFLRSIAMMVEESEAPASEEFERVLAETRLGDPLIDALQRMSDRMGIADLAWVVQAIRIQQSVGGKLGELLSTLSDFMRAREEVRREVRVLTAEGRLSAHILGGLPFFMLGVLQMLNPEYIRPLFSGGGLLMLCAATVSVLIGVVFIKKMAQVEV